MAGTIVVDRIESDASYASTINVAGQITFSNTVNFGAYSGTAPVAGFYLPTTNNLAFTTASTERMRINSSGNVGIGTSSPSARVDNTGTFRSTGATDPTSGTGLELSYRSTYGDVLAYNRTSSAFVQLQIRAEPIIFGNSGGERMRIDSSGNVGIGTQANPTLGMVEIKHTAGNSPFYVNSTATAVNSRITLNTTSDTSSVSYVLSNNNAGVNKQASFYLISSNGGLQFQTGQTAGAEPTTGTACFRVQNDFVGVITPTTRLGYDTGAGGTVTQATSKSTAVTLNKPTGQITMSSASLGASTDITFTLNNSLISTTDIVTINATWPTAASRYQAYVTSSNSGSCQIVVRNRDSGSAYSEAVVLNFAIIKGATS